MQENKTEWFRHWFDSTYYHQLYRHRDEKEAEFFLRHLINYLKLEQGDKILDMPCGRGRHALFLSKCGYDVTGVDLSRESIRYATQHTSETLKFYVHDMRQPLYSNYFKYVLNLFTSLGYFKWKYENFTVIKNMASSLVHGGKLVIDFLNSEKVSKTISDKEVKVIDEIEFHLSKEVRENKIIKKIEFQTEGKDHLFQEEVSLLNISDFEKFLSDAGLMLIDTFGSYDLQAYDPLKSDRLILIAEKP